MKDWQQAVYLWDVYPKFVLAGKETTVTVKPLGFQSAFPKDDFKLYIRPLHERHYKQDDTPKNDGEYTVHANADGSVQVTHSFEHEQEYFICMMINEKIIPIGSVYCVEQDLYSLIPLAGDQHIHTIRSDGKNDPAYTAAAFRAQGYDYIAITDHRNYIGSAEAIEAYQDIPLDFNMMYGEEVHMPDAEIHIVNFGSRRSVNAMTQGNVETMKKKNDPEIAERHKKYWQKGEGSEFPGTMTDDEFRAMIWKYAETLDIPEGISKYTYATFKWVCNEIRKCGGLAIFAHPFWITSNAYHVDERLTEYIFEQHDFDAYEVLGGELYFEQNGLQTIHYYEQLAKGLNFPIVGSSDTHNVLDRSVPSQACCASTIVFAKENTMEAIHEAIRSGMTVAVDWISRKEPRLVGSYRLVKVAQFLMNNYFPVHNSVCEAEAQAMMDYKYFNPEAGERVLKASYGRIPAMWRKYFPGNQAK